MEKVFQNLLLERIKQAAKFQYLKTYKKIKRNEGYFPPAFYTKKLLLYPLSNKSVSLGYYRKIRYLYRLYKMRHPSNPIPFDYFRILRIDWLRGRGKRMRI